MSGSATFELTPEDGSIVANANTYASVAMLRQYAVQRAVTLPSDDGVCGPFLMLAMDYVESKIDRWQGTTVTAAAQYQARYSGIDPSTILQQALTWPRHRVMVDGTWLPYTSIPQRLIDAQCQLACDVFAGNIPLPTVQGLQDGGLKMKRIGPITKQWFDPSKLLTSSLAPMFMKADAKLTPLYKPSSGPLRVGRL